MKQATIYYPLWPKEIIDEVRAIQANIKMLLTANTPITEAFASTADWQSAMQFCRNLEMVLNQQREALDVADECLALIEEVGHGAMSDNVTAARGVIEKAIRFSSTIHPINKSGPRWHLHNEEWVKELPPEQLVANPEYTDC